MLFGYFTMKKMEGKPLPAIIIDLGPEYGSREGEKLLIKAMTYSASGPTIGFKTDDEDMEAKA